MHTKQMLTVNREMGEYKCGGVSNGSCVVVKGYVIMYIWCNRM